MTNEKGIYKKSKKAKGLRLEILVEFISLICITYRGNSNGLHIVDCSGATKQSDISRERRLQTRLALLALNGLDERRFLSTDVRASTTVYEYVEIVTGTTGVLTNQTGLVCLKLHIFCKVSYQHAGC